MGQIEWAMWANEQAIASSLITILGGIIGIVGFFKRWQFGIYGVAAGVFIFLFEYPRSLRAKGKSSPRKCQFPFTVFVNLFGPLARIYYFRFVLYFLMCVPLVFILPTFLGGLCLLFTSTLYFVAALKGEHWQADLPQNDNTTTVDAPMTPVPQRRPPPRRPELPVNHM
ncbi:cytochrome b-245 light chain isoform X1 [Octopus bimaculoides]|uniref:Cytochrome b-245 light chain n=1 Tax=Octopus bimaculoides TaxID=37653 RepID=A0A0L8HH13_OCTBM|nr:cytochrome b-245 light chain isoform X1 [Octopus bimaculoides]|eukprot:XP_014772336.1 PREDICTED: cytochrome b-245 light chain-like [Octopus bimaculoides]